MCWKCREREREQQQSRKGYYDSNEVFESGPLDAFFQGGDRGLRDHVRRRDENRFYDRNKSPWDRWNS